MKGCKKPDLCFQNRPGDAIIEIVKPYQDHGSVAAIMGEILSQVTFQHLASYFEKTSRITANN